MSAPLAQRPLDTTVAVVTPENIAFEYQLAGIGRRGVAFLLDFGIRIAAWLCLLVALSFLGAFTLLDPGIVMAVLLLLLFFSEWFYGACLESYWNGQTIGKRMQGIRVLQTNGQPINGVQAVLRNVLRVVDMMPLLPLGDLMSEEVSMLAVPTCLFCLLSMMMTKRLQRLGDLVCGTMVVLETTQSAHSLQLLDDREILTLASDLPGDLHLTRSQARAISNYVGRRKGFAHAHRLELTRPLANALAVHWKLPRPADTDRFLCAVYHRAFISDCEPADAPAIVAPEPVAVAGEHR